MKGNSKVICDIRGVWEDINTGPFRLNSNSQFSSLVSIQFPLVPTKPPIPSVLNLLILILFLFLNFFILFIFFFIIFIYIIPNYYLIKLSFYWNHCIIYRCLNLLHIRFAQVKQINLTCKRPVTIKNSLTFASLT